MQILQSSPQAILNWNQFNIGLGETVRFLQPSTQAAILNRVTGTDPSLIQGMLQANGNVFLLNPNGILFGPNSVVDVGSFTASTLKMSDDDFLSGTYKLTQDRTLPLAAITNQGQIHVADGGFVVLTSPLLDNQGLIVAQSGSVHLGATTQATFSLDGRGQVQFAMPDGFNPQFTGGGQGGAVLLQPGQLSGILTQVVSNPGLVEAGSLTPTNNGQTLAHGAEGVLINSGTVQADGGTIRLDSSQTTVLTSAGVIQAQNGEARVLSDGSTLSLGSVNAPGGFVEISAEHLALYGPVSASSVLLDPNFIQIINDVAGNGSQDADVLANMRPTADGTVSTGAIAAVANVTLQADLDVTYLRTSAPDLIAPGTDLTIIAGRNITLDPGRSNIELASLTLNAGNNIELHNTGVVKMNAGGISMTTTTGDILIDSTTHISFETPQTVNLTSGQDIIIGLPGGFVFNEAATASVITAQRNVSFRFDQMGQPTAHTLNVAATTGNVDIRANTGDSLFYVLGGGGLNVTAGGTITGHADGALNIGTGAGNLRLISTGALSLDSNSNVALQFGAGSATLQGSSVTVAANGGLNLNGQGNFSSSSTNGQIRITNSGDATIRSSGGSINLQSTGGDILYSSTNGNLNLLAPASTATINSSNNLTLHTGNANTLALDGNPTTLQAAGDIDIQTNAITGGNKGVVMTAGGNVTFNPAVGNNLGITQTQTLRVGANNDVVANVTGGQILVDTTGDQAWTAGRNLTMTSGSLQTYSSSGGKIGWQGGSVKATSGSTQSFSGLNGVTIRTTAANGADGNLTLLNNGGGDVSLQSNNADVNVTSARDLSISAPSQVSLKSNSATGVTTANATGNLTMTTGNGQTLFLGGSSARLKSGNDMTLTTDSLLGDLSANTALNFDSGRDLRINHQGPASGLIFRSASINATAVNDMLVDGGSSLFLTSSTGNLRLQGDRNLSLTTTGALQLSSAGTLNLQGGNVTTNAGGDTLIQSATGTSVTATTGNVNLTTGGTELRLNSTGGSNTISAGGNVSLVEPQNLVMIGTANIVRATNGNIDIGTGGGSFSPSSFSPTGQLLIDAGGNVTYTGATLSSGDAININTQNGDVTLQSLTTGNLNVSSAAGLNITAGRDLIGRSNVGNVNLSTTGAADLKLAAGRNVSLQASNGAVSVVSGAGNLSITGQNVTVQALNASALRSNATGGKTATISATAGNLDLQVTGTSSDFAITAPDGVLLSATGTLGIRSGGTGTAINATLGNVTLNGGIDSTGAVLTIRAAGLNILSSSTTNFAAGSVATATSAGVNGNSTQDLDLSNLRLNVSGGNVTLNASRNLKVGTIGFPATANATLSGGNVTLQSMQNIGSGNLTITTPGNLTEINRATSPATLPGLNITAGQIHNLNNTADNVSFSIPNTSSPATLNVTVTGGNDTVVPSAANLRNFNGANVQPVSITGTTGDVYVDGVLRTAGQAPSPPPPSQPTEPAQTSPIVIPQTGLTAEQRAQILAQSNLALGNLGSYRRVLGPDEIDHFTAKMDSLHSPWNNDPFSPTLALVLPGGPPVVSAQEAAELAQMLGLDVAAAVNTLLAQEFGFIWEVRYWRHLTERLILWEDKE